MYDHILQTLDIPNELYNIYCFKNRKQFSMGHFLPLSLDDNCCTVSVYMYINVMYINMIRLQFNTSYTKYEQQLS